jgi:hypothetical protein
MPSDGSEPRSLPSVPPTVARWVKTECGRAKYLELASRPGPWARLRLWWFVGIAALRDLSLPPRDSGG